jgi:hypothetical protein
MKKLILFLVASLLAIPGFSQFKAKMLFTSMGQERVFMVYSADTGYRYEFNENNMDGVIIVKNASPEVIILMPQQKMAMKGLATDPMSMGNDPVATFKYYQNEGLMKEEGKEVVNGVACTRSGLWNKDNPDQKIYTVWTSEMYSFPIKLINHIDGSGNAIMEIKEIQPWIPDANSFEIPGGYQVMDMPRM